MGGGGLVVAVVVKVGSKFKRFGSDGSSLKVALARWALGPINSHKLGRVLGFGWVISTKSKTDIFIRFGSDDSGFEIMPLMRKMRKYKPNQNRLNRAG